jgi:hypothetical protein
MTGRDPAGHRGIVFELDGEPHGPGDDLSSGRDDDPQWIRLVRPCLTPVLLLALAGVAVLLYGPVGGSRTGASPTPPDAPDTGQEVSARQTADPDRPGLIAPATARPGQPIIVVGFRDSTLCGPSELRFDDSPVVYRVDATARQRNPGWVEVIMVMGVPDTASPGSHVIQLWGPARGGDRMVCGNVPAHQEQLDTREIEIAAA